MSNRPTRHCRVCGAAFEASPADSTVNCPAHRGRAVAAAKAAAARTIVGHRISVTNGASFVVTAASGPEAAAMAAAMKAVSAAVREGKDTMEAATASTQGVARATVERAS